MLFTPSVDSDHVRDARLVLVVSEDCRLCEQARLLLERLGLAFREVDLGDDEAGDLARRGIPVVLFPILLDADRIVAYGDISEADVRRALPLEAAS